jgi:predicted DNA-binding transcriptional regulator AlpA
VPVVTEVRDEQKPQQVEQKPAPTAATAPNQPPVETAEPELVFLTKKQVLAKIPITAPTLWAWCRSGKFPRPREISLNKPVWLQSEVDAWMKARPLRQYKP